MTVPVLERGTLLDIAEAAHRTAGKNTAWPVAVSSASFLAELSVRSPRKLFIFIILKKNCGSKYPKIKLFNFEKESTDSSASVHKFISLF